MSILKSLLKCISHPKQRGSVPPSSALDPLETVLFRWTPKDAFTVRNLLDGGIAVMGRTGSGKTSSSGRLIGEAIVRYRRSGGLITAAKPGDVALWKTIFEAAGRSADLLIFSPSENLRCNFLDHALRLSGDTSDLVHCIQTIGESLHENNGGGTGNQEPFWRQQSDRLLFFSIVILRLALGGKISAIELQRFIATAAMSLEQLSDPKWTAGLHCRYLEAAHGAPKSDSEKHDFQLATDYFLSELPSMADRTRSSILAQIMGILHVFVTGVARSLVSGETNVSPNDMFNGKFILVNMSPSEWGVAGRFVSAGWKYLTQRTVLKRDAKTTDCINVIWCDEAHQFVNSYDAIHAAQARSHLGAMVFLSQSLSGYYAALKGDDGENYTQALLGNFAHTIVHAVDPITAEWAVKKLGKRRETLFGGSSTAPTDIFDELFGKSRFTGSFSEHYENVLQEGVLINGLRTGSKVNSYACDAIVIRSGIPFSTSENYLWKTFYQE